MTKKQKVAARKNIEKGIDRDRRVRIKAPDDQDLAVGEQGRGVVKAAGVQVARSGERARRLG